MIMAIILYFVGAIVYFIPTIVAVKRKHNNETGIVLLNIFTGWIYGIGWVAALIWACSDNVKKEEENGTV